jgi:5-hydroxyisourate hydrolase
MPGISIHVVDVALGKPASGMFVEVHALNGEIRRVVGTGVVGDNGALEHPMNGGDGVAAGCHEVLLHAGEYFRVHGTRQRQARVPGNRAFALHGARRRRALPPSGEDFALGNFRLARRMSPSVVIRRHFKI